MKENESQPDCMEIGLKGLGSIILIIASCGITYDLTQGSIDRLYCLAPALGMIFLGYYIENVRHNRDRQ